MGPPEGDPTSTMYVRRRPTLPQPLGCSTIGAERLNFRVRYGTGCFPFRYGRRNSFNLMQTPRPPTSGVGWVGFVGWELPSGREQDSVSVGSLRMRCFTCPTHPWWGVLCVVLYVVGTSPRPISTGRLGIAAVYLRPINPIVCGGPYQVCPVGNFILKCASRLDAFSGYHVRT